MVNTLAIATLVASAIAAPFSFPLSNGFPNPNATEIALIQKHAGGTLPTMPLPKDLTPALITTLQLVAAQEIFEVAYFTSLLHNITANVPGYECTDQDHKYVESVVHRIRAQEELHALGANAILQTNGAQTVGACKYTFPVSDFASAIKLANTFTDVVLGVLQVVQLQTATAGGPHCASLVPLFGSIAEQEAEQDGWFRVLQTKAPSAAPFLTGAAPEFALSALKPFLVPGSCPPEYTTIQNAVKSFSALNVIGAPTEGRQTVTFSIAGTVASGNMIAYVSGQNIPITVDIANVKTDYGVTTFDAPFPAQAQGFADGLTLAALVTEKASFTNATEVAAKTLYGPGLIEYGTNTD